MDKDVLGTAPVPQGGDHLDDLLAAARAQGRPAGDSADHGGSKLRWERGLAIGLALTTAAGALGDSVAASQLVTSGGPAVFGLVWPLGASSLVVLAVTLMRVIDRFRRVVVLRALCLAYAAGFVITLAGYASGIPRALPSALAWTLADQLLMLIPVVIWVLAGDVFTAGQSASVYPRIARWQNVGQGAGFLISAVAAPWLSRLGVPLVALLIVPAGCCVAIAIITPRALVGAPTATATQAGESGSATGEAIRLVASLPSLRWLWWSSCAVVTAGAAIEFGFLDVLHIEGKDAADVQLLYAATALTAYTLCWIVQSTIASRALKRFGIERMLQVLPVATLAAGAVMLVAIGVPSIAAAAVALVMWRVPRWSVDVTARNAALALVPDSRRGRVAFVLSLGPPTAGFIAVGIPIALVAVTGMHQLAAITTLSMAALAVAASAMTARRWADTQLSFRLKRRRRLG
jgi:hypothetical protein